MCTAQNLVLAGTSILCNETQQINYYYYYYYKYSTQHLFMTTLCLHL
jgi:hypothetical protein